MPRKRIARVGEKAKPGNLLRDFKQSQLLEEFSTLMVIMKLFRIRALECQFVSCSVIIQLCNT